MRHELFKAPHRFYPVNREPERFGFRRSLRGPLTLLPSYLQADLPQEQSVVGRQPKPSDPPQNQELGARNLHGWVRIQDT